MQSIYKECSVLMLGIVISFVTPLSEWGGYVLMFSLITAIGFKLPIVATKHTVIFLSLFCLSFILFLFMTHSAFVNTSVITNGVLMVTIAAVFSYLSKMPIKGNKEKALEPSRRYMYAFDLIFFLFYIICIKELIFYAISHIETWEYRGHGAAQVFMCGYHHVDFSVVVMAVFMIGLKRGYRIASITLAVISGIVLDTRTMYLFYFLFVIFWIFKEIIYKICIKNRFLDRCYKWMLIFIVSILLLSSIWLFVLLKIYPVVNERGFLWDLSNLDRFKSIWYAFQIIKEKRLFFGGIDTTIPYETLLLAEGFEGMNIGPHNSYFSLLLKYSLFFGGLYLYWISKYIDNAFSAKTVPYIFPYLICGCILHDMFLERRIMLFLLILLIPFGRPKTQIRIVQ